MAATHNGVACSFPPTESIKCSILTFFEIFDVQRIFSDNNVEKKFKISFRHSSIVSNFEKELVIAQTSAVANLKYTDNV